MLCQIAWLRWIDAPVRDTRDRSCAIFHLKNCKFNQGKDATIKKKRTKVKKKILHAGYCCSYSVWRFERFAILFQSRFFNGTSYRIEHLKTFLGTEEMNSRGQRSGHCASHLLRERNTMLSTQPNREGLSKCEMFSLRSTRKACVNKFGKYLQIFADCQTQTYKHRARGQKKRTENKLCREFAIFHFGLFRARTIVSRSDMAAILIGIIWYWMNSNNIIGGNVHVARASFQVLQLFNVSSLRKLDKNENKWSWYYVIFSTWDEWSWIFQLASDDILLYQFQFPLRARNSICSKLNIRYI